MRHCSFDLAEIHTTMILEIGIECNSDWDAWEKSFRIYCTRDMSTGRVLKTVITHLVGNQRYERYQNVCVKKTFQRIS